MTKAIDAFSKYFLYLTCRVSWSVCLSAWPGGCGVTIPQYCCLSGPAALRYGSSQSYLCNTGMWGRAWHSAAGRPREGGGRGPQGTRELSVYLRRRRHTDCFFIAHGSPEQSGSLWGQLCSSVDGSSWLRLLMCFTLFYSHDNSLSIT